MYLLTNRETGMNGHESKHSLPFIFGFDRLYEFSSDFLHENIKFDCIEYSRSRILKSLEYLKS